MFYVTMFTNEDKYQSPNCYIRNRKLNFLSYGFRI